MIIEGIVTTLDADGAVHLAPMGPHVDDALNHLVLRPYSTSHTYQNLLRSGEGVFHITDDVLLLARAAIGRINSVPVTFAATQIRGHVIAEACRYFEFRVCHVDDSKERVRMEVDVVATGRLRDFLGFNRGKHAVVEAAILATRIAFLPRQEIKDQLERLRPLVEKTGGGQETEAFAF